ncbi:MAG: hypothetical protein ACP5N2_00245 [Candidatus Nanoarchaeia archaeon]
MADIAEGFQSKPEHEIVLEGIISTEFFKELRADIKAQYSEPASKLGWNLGFHTGLLPNNNYKFSIVATYKGNFLNKLLFDETNKEKLRKLIPEKIVKDQVEVFLDISYMEGFKFHLFRYI